MRFVSIQVSQPNYTCCDTCKFYHWVDCSCSKGHEITKFDFTPACKEYIDHNAHLKSKVI